ncbi:MAG: hypothetical protein AB7D03_05060 [Thiomicrospira sp.]
MPMLNHFPSAERRRATRQKRNFKVRIKGQTYAGLDVSAHGFSIMVTDNYINFSLNQLIDSVYITNLNTQTNHTIRRVKVASKRGTRYFIYGFSLVELDPGAQAKHAALANGGHASCETTLSAPAQIEPNQSERAAPQTKQNLIVEKQFLINLMSASNNPALSDADFRRYVKSQLIKLAKNQPL